MFSSHDVSAPVDTVEVYLNVNYLSAAAGVCGAKEGAQKSINYTHREACISRKAAREKRQN